MRLIFLPILCAFCWADEACNIPAECAVNILKRLSALENENWELKNQVQIIKIENGDLKNKNEELTNDVLAIEKIVLPEKFRLRARNTKIVAQQKLELTR